MVAPGLVLIVVAFMLARYFAESATVPEAEAVAVALAEEPVAESAPPRHRPTVAQMEARADARLDRHPAIRRFEEINRYPSSSRRLTEDSVDLLNPNMRHENRGPLPDFDGNDDLAWEVRYTADRYFIRGSEALEVSLALWHEGEPVIPSKVTMTAEPGNAVDAPDSVRLKTVLSGNEITAQFVADEHWPDYLGQAHVAATFEADGLAEQTGFLSFYFTPERLIPARFTGQFSDDASDGNLVIGVGVEVDVAGTYHIEGNLFDADDQPVGWARYAGPLAEGVQRAPLEFYGLIFHDADAWAPFTLRDLRGYRVRRGDSPHREDMPSYGGEYLTADQYALADFSSREHESPRKQRMLEMYRDALERGVRLTDPDSVGGQRR